MNHYMQEIHQIGHQMSDVKATMRRDIEIKVGDVSISGKEGEVVGVPLWAGEMLQKGGLADLDEHDAVNDLKQALVKEKVAGEYHLATLDGRFYIRLWWQMERLDRHDRDRVGGIMMELVRMRRGKIVRLADSGRLTGEIKSRITIEERILYESISAQSSAFEEMVIRNE